MNIPAKMILFSIIIPLIGAAIYALFVTEQDNFHQITKGEAYRSAQMDRDKLMYCLRNYHIRSILNLRGKDLLENWYIDELKISEECNVIHYDVSLSAYAEPTKEETQILMNIIKAAPRPILIHCQAGADRTGLVAAMWKVIVDKESKGEASKQLSILYGHLPLGPAFAMDQFFNNWRPELEPVYCAVSREK
ncbi:MAG: dual specificity protein phosphatase family protein [Oryzomonas sp.]|jgi:undecaprenyl-diphosphatase